MAQFFRSFGNWQSAIGNAIVHPMIHENLSQAIENLSARMIAIRDSL
jgi:hypothetical protein